jgi:hypothetical protein
MNSNAQKLINDFVTTRDSLHKEEDVRAGFTTVLKELSSVMGFDLQLTGHEVVSTHGGSADSVYNNVIFEYKSPHKFNTKHGIDEAVFGRSTSLTDRGLFHYLINFTLDENSNYDDEFSASLKSKIGVGFDGYKFVFCRFIDSEDEIELYCKDKTSEFGKINSNAKLKFEVDEVDDFYAGLKKLLLVLRSTTRYRLSGKTLLTKFGPSSALCKQSISKN